MTVQAKGPRMVVHTLWSLWWPGAKPPFKVASAFFGIPSSTANFENKRLHRLLQPVLWRAAQNPYRWLNLETLCRLLLPKNTIQQIKYFTALVSALPNRS